jgi:MFS family permease
LVVRSWPADRGLLPDGAAVTSSKPLVAVGASFVQAKASRFYRYLCAVYALVFLAQVGGIAHLYNLTDERESTATAATVLSVVALSSVIGRLVGGALATRVSTRAMTLVLVVVQAAALAFIGVADSRLLLFVAAAVFGLSIGNLLMLQPLLLAETYGVREYSRIYSFNQLFGTIGVAGGPFMVGALRDLFDYRAAFLVAAAANVIGLSVLVMAGTTEAARQQWEHPANLVN